MLTASDVGPILGFSPYRKPIDVWAEKRGLLPEQPDNNLLRWGRRNEPAILDEYAEFVSPLRRRTRATPYRVVTVPDFKLLGATLDARRVDDGRPVDAKNVRFRDEKWRDDSCPDTYKCQLAVQMMAVGAQCADLAVLFSGCEFYTYTLHRDARLDDYIREHVTAWWQKHIVEGVMPEPDSSDSYTEFLRTQFAKNTEVMKLPDQLCLDWAREYAQATQAVAEAEKRAQHAQQFLMQYTGDAAGIEGVLTWRSNKDRQVVDWQAVANTLSVDLMRLDLDEVVAAHTTTKPGARVFRLAKGLLTDGN